MFVDATLFQLQILVNLAVSQRSGGEKDGFTHEQRAAPEVLHAWQLLGDHFFSPCCRRIVVLLTVRDSSIGDIFTHSLAHSVSHLLISSLVTCRRHK